jgi:hypothetical protein
MTWRKGVGVLLFGVAVAAVSVPALGQPRVPTAQELETARTLFKEGRELRAKGDLPGALEKFQAAHALGNTPVTGIELARTYVAIGLIVEARETCLSIARIPVAGDETEKSAEARASAASLAEDLRPRIPTLLVHVAGLAPGEKARLLVDDVAVPEAAIGEAQKVNPGRHEVVVRAGEGPAARQVRGAAEVSPGEVGQITLTLPAVVMPLPAGAPADERPQAARGPSTLALLGLVTGIGGAATGLVTGLVAINKKNQVASECQNKNCINGTQGVSDLQTARAWATAANVSFAVAGAGALTFVLARLLASDRGPAASPARVDVTPWVGLGAVGVHGRF